MKLQGKLFLLITLSLLAFGVAVGLNQFLSLTRESRDRIEAFRQEQLAQTQQTLKNYVDIAYETVAGNYSNSQDKRWLESHYGPRLSSIIDMAETIVTDQQKAVAAGQCTIGEAQGRAIEAIRRLRYDNGTGYIWINDTGRPIPRMVMHPTVPALDGKVLDDAKFNCALGKKQNLFQAFNDVCARDGAGFVDYLWPKPTKDGLTTEQPKLSYVRLIPDWNWIIGTGIYVDDAREDAIAKTRADLAKMRYDNGTGYFWINDTGRPIPRMVMHPTVPALDGKVLDDAKFRPPDLGR